MNIKFLLFLLLSSLSVKFTYSQFLDIVTLFKPRMNVNGEYVLSQKNDLSGRDIYGGGFGVFVPIKSKLDVNVNWQDALKIKKVSDVRNALNVNAYQVFTNFGGGYSNFSILNNNDNLYSVYGGVTAYHLKFKKKFKLNVYSVKVDVREDFESKTIIPNYQILLGRVKFFNLNTQGFIGAYASYANNSSFIPVPVFAINTKLNSTYSFLFMFPVQARITAKVSSGFKQDLVLGLNTRNSGIADNNFGVLKRYYFSEYGLKFSTQSRLRLADKAFLFAELGWQDFTTINYYDGGSKTATTHPKGNFFAKASLYITFGKGLFGSGSLDLEL